MFQGSFKLIKKNVNTGEISYESDWIENNVTLDHLRGRMDTNSASNSSRIGPNIVISEWDGPTSEETGQLINPHAIGVDVVSPTFNGNGADTPYYVEYQQTFSPPGADRDINAIGVTNNTISNNAITVDAWTHLSTTCTQTTVETLIVFYRVQFLANTGSRYHRQRQYGMAQFYGFNTEQLQFPYETSHYPLANMFDGIEPGAHVSGVSGQGLIIQPGREEPTAEHGPASTFENAYFAKRFTHSAVIADTIGQIRGSIKYKKNSSTKGRAYWWNNLLPPGTGKVQNIYSHSSAATKPFFDPGTIPTTDGTLAINSGAWTDPDYPFLYRIDITGSGAVGAGTYKFRRRRQLGFTDNNYLSRGLGVHGFNKRNEGTYGILGPADNINNSRCANTSGSNRGEVVHVYNNRWIFVADNSSVVFFDIISGKAIQFNSTTFGAFTPTDIGQYEYDELSDTVWVSCESTGIYSINDPLGSPTVTFHDITGATGTIVGPLANQAYAIDLGLSQTTHRTVWAFVQGALVKSTDNGSTWVAHDSTSAGVTFTEAYVEANWNRVGAIRCHKTHADEQMMIYYQDGTTQSSAPAAYATWWDTVNDWNRPWSATETMTRLFSQTAGFNAENRRCCHRMLGMSPNDERFAFCGVISTGHPSVSQNNTPVWLTYGQGAAGMTDSDSGLSNGGRTPQTDSGGGNISTNHIEFGTDDAGNDFIWFANEGESDLWACVQTGGVVKVQELSSYTGVPVPDIPVAAYTDGFLAYLGNGLFLLSDNTNNSSKEERAVVHMPISASGEPLGQSNYENEEWETYGWTGSAWALGNAGSKTIHSSTDALIDGLTISFDDAGATQTFVATDYFTAGIMDGVQLDANTEYDWAGSLYFQPSTDITTLEFTSVPASDALPTIKSYTWGNEGDYTDIAGLDAIITGGVNGNSFDDINKTGTSGTAGARLDQEAEANFRLRVDCFTNTSIALGSGTMFGVSAASVLGNALVLNNIEYGFYMSGGSAATVDIDIRVSGVNVLNVETDLNMTAFLTGLDMVIERVGNDLFFYWMGKLVHTINGIVATNYVPEFIIDNGADARIIVREWEHTWTDRWTFIGTSGSLTGAFDSEYRTIDINAQDYSLRINGVEGTLIGPGDRTTALSAGEYSIFPESGAIRLSAADAGLSVAGNFTYLQKS